MAEENGGGEGASSNSESRWTCEACSCHTNTEAHNPSNCGLCGTSRRGKQLLFDFKTTFYVCILFLFHGAVRLEDAEKRVF